MVTIESAISMAAFFSVVLLSLVGLLSVGAYVSAIDIAGAAARAHAVGEPFAPPRGTVEVHDADGMVQVTARVPSPLGNMSAQAKFPQELVE